MAYAPGGHVKLKASPTAAWSWSSGSTYSCVALLAVAFPNASDAPVGASVAFAGDDAFSAAAEASEATTSPHAAAWGSRIGPVPREEIIGRWKQCTIILLLFLGGLELLGLRDFLRGAGSY